MESRVKEIDYLKCIFITLMIIFHLVYIGDKYPYAKQIVYTFHMSAFLIISGYLANNRKDARSFLRKFLWIFIPYACMEAAYTVMSHFLPVRESVDAITPTVLLDKIFLHPMGPYWYLHTLILCSLIYYITFRYVRLSVVSRLVVTGVCLFALSHWGGLMNFSNGREARRSYRCSVLSYDKHFSVNAKPLYQNFTSIPSGKSPNLFDIFCANSCILLTFSVI